MPANAKTPQGDVLDWEQNLQLMLKTRPSNAAYLLCDRSGVIRAASASITRMTGFVASSLAGWSPSVLQGRDTCKSTVHAIREALRDPRNVNLTVLLLNYTCLMRPFWMHLTIETVPIGLLWTLRSFPNRYIVPRHTCFVKWYRILLANNSCTIVHSDLCEAECGQDIHSTFLFPNGLTYPFGACGTATVALCGTRKVVIVLEAPLTLMVCYLSDRFATTCAPESKSTAPPPIYTRQFVLRTFWQRLRSVLEPLAHFHDLNLTYFCDIPPGLRANGDDHALVRIVASLIIKTIRRSGSMWAKACMQGIHVLLVLNIVSTKLAPETLNLAEARMLIERHNGSINRDINSVTLSLRLRQSSVQRLVQLRKCFSDGKITTSPPKCLKSDLTTGQV